MPSAYTVLQIKSILTNLKLFIPLWCRKECSKYVAYCTVANLNSMKYGHLAKVEGAGWIAVAAPNGYQVTLPFKTSLFHWHYPWVLDRNTIYCIKNLTIYIFVLQDRMRQVRSVLWPSSGTSSVQWAKTGQTFTDGSFVHFTKKSSPSLTTSCHASSFCQRNVLSGWIWWQYNHCRILGRPQCWAWMSACWPQWFHHFQWWSTW